MKSEIYFFTLNSLDLQINVFVKRIFKYFYKERPLKPKYFTFWQVLKLLDLLKSEQLCHDLTLKQLTLKTLALIALISSDRGQTINLAKIENLLLAENYGVHFFIKDRIKTTRKIQGQK